MRSRHPRLAVLWASCLLAVLLTPVRAAGPQLLVLNKGNLTMVTVDPATLKVTGSYPSGPDPHEVVASSDGTRAYISNYTEGGTISVIDLERRTALPPIDLGVLVRPHGLDFAGGKLYFTAEGSKVVGRYDPAARRIDWIMGTGQNRTHMIMVSKDLKRMITTNIASASVSFIDQVQGTTPNAQAAPLADWNITSVPAGRGAEGYDLSPDGKELWVGNGQERTLSIIDPIARKPLQTLTVPTNRINRVKFTQDGRFVFVSDLRGNELLVLDAARRSEVKRLDLGTGTTGVAGILMEPNGSRAFVSVGSKNIVAIVDTRTLTISGRIESGPAPDGLAWVAAN